MADNLGGSGEKYVVDVRVVKKMLRKKISVIQH